jgi:23S rRNA pseudouridine1911/1915/1917 synthase
VGIAGGGWAGLLRLGRMMKKPPREIRFSRKIHALYHDDAVVAINKPAGLAAVPAPNSDARSALSMICEELRPIRRRAFVVHRIDRYTSGVMLFALTETDRDVLVKQFLSHTPTREYRAVVRGHLTAKEGTLIHHFRREGMFQKPTTARDPNGARAELHYTVERQLTGASLVRVALVTGLQNQIRVQFSAIGHPVVGDRKYHPKEAEERRIARVALHASKLEFRHPRSREPVSVACEPPPDFQALVRGLAGRGRG